MENKVYVVIGGESLEPNISVYDPITQSIIAHDSVRKDLVIEHSKVNRICYICGKRDLFRTNTFTTTDSVSTLINTKIFCEGGCPVVTEVCDIHTDDEEYSRFVATHVMVTKSNKDKRSSTTAQSRCGCESFSNLGSSWILKNHTAILPNAEVIKGSQAPKPILPNDEE